VDVIFKAIDKIEEGLGHSPHPAITDLPVGAWTVSSISDVMGIVTRDKSYDDCARISMGIGLFGAAGAVLTGLRDYSFIPRDRQPNHHIATRHALGNALVGTLFTASYFLRAREEQAGRRTGLLARLLGLTGGSLLLYTAWLGGKLVEELGEAVKPVMEQQDKPKREPQPVGRQKGDGAAPGQTRHITVPAAPASEPVRKRGLSLGGERDGPLFRTGSEALLANL
jgi:uncharacterized membrane protein